MFLIQHKSEALQDVSIFCNLIEKTQFNKKIKAFRTENCKRDCIFLFISKEMDTTSIIMYSNSTAEFHCQEKTPLTKRGSIFILSVTCAFSLLGRMCFDATYLVNRVPSPSTQK